MSRHLLTNASSTNNLAFLSGVQITACVEILIGYYNAIVSSSRTMIPIVGALLLGVSSYCSLALTWQIGEIRRMASTRARDTLIKKGALMDDELSKLVKVSLFGTIRRISIMRAYLIIDVALSVTGLAMIVLSKLFV